MKHLILLTLSIFLFTACGQKYNWQKVVSKDKTFEVSWPNKPEIQDLKDVKPMDGESHELLHDASGYLASYFIISEAYLKERGYTKMFDDSLKANLKTLDGTLISQEDTTLLGFPAKVVEFSYFKNKVKLRLKRISYLVKNRIYLTQTITPFYESYGDADIFHLSFKIFSDNITK